MSCNFKKSRATRDSSTPKSSLVMTTDSTHDKDSKIFDNQQDVEDLIPCQSCLFWGDCEVNLKDCMR